jgi:hypothetical protein
MLYRKQWHPSCLLHYLYLPRSHANGSSALLRCPNSWGQGYLLDIACMTSGDAGAGDAIALQTNCLPALSPLTATTHCLQGAPQQVEFSVEYARDALDAGRTLQRSLLAHKAELRGSGPLVTVQVGSKGLDAGCSRTLCGSMFMQVHVN